MSKYQLFLPLSTEEQEALRQDIAVHGVKVPVLFDEEGNILDGHHRAELAKEMGKEYPKEILSGLTEAEKKATVYRSNMARRNLSPSQKKEIRKHMKKVALELKQEGKTQKEVGELIGVDQSTISLWLGDVSNMSTHIPYVPDSRVTIPKAEYERIFSFSGDGKTHEQLAADYGVTRPRISQIVKTVSTIKARKAPAKEPPKWIGDWQIDKVFLADVTKPEFAKSLPKNSVDLILSDPPWKDTGQEDDDPNDTGFYEALGRISERVLKPGHFACIYIGKMYMKEILDVLCAYLDYVWCFAVAQPNSQWRLRKAQVYECWRPIVVMKKPGERIETLWRSDLILDSTRDKSFHEWQQAIEPPTRLIEKYTRPNELVLDPFVGGGTFVAASYLSGRHYLGFDKNDQAIRDTLARLNNVRLLEF